MFHKIKSVLPQKDHTLIVHFSEGVTKKYDVKQLFDKYDNFKQLLDKTLFYECRVDVGGYGVIWNDILDLSCDELFHNGLKLETPFDNLLSFGDATTIWGLNESTLRKAISYGKLVEGIDVMKYGKQWVITMDAMVREYGEPK